MKDKPSPETLIKFVRDLANKEAHAVGFIPDTTYGPALERGTLKIVYDVRDPVGFILHGPMAPECRIYQTAVIPDARLLDYGRHLWLETLIAAAPTDCEAITWICAEDLPANTFWHRVTNARKGIEPGPRPDCRRRFWYRHLLARGEELERFLDTQLRRTAAGKICELQGIYPEFEKAFKKRFRKQGMTK